MDKLEAHQGHIIAAVVGIALAGLLLACGL
jgi:hypothetical protein